jgi:phosphonate C-P lyase system protein PhnH
MAAAMIASDALRHQRNYRLLLDAFSRPGQTVRLELPDRPLAPAMAVGACLLDGEVSLCVVGAGVGPTLSRALAAETGVRITDLARADFVFIVDPSVPRCALDAKRGTPALPHEGATLVYCANDALRPAEGPSPFRLQGPGIAPGEGLVPSMRGIPETIWRELRQANAEYPMGVDALFVRSDGETMSIPRSTRILER